MQIRVMTLAVCAFADLQHPRNKLFALGKRSFDDDRGAFFVVQNSTTPGSRVDAVLPPKQDLVFRGVCKTHTSLFTVMALQNARHDLSETQSVSELVDGSFFSAALTTIVPAAEGLLTFLMRSAMSAGAAAMICRMARACTTSDPCWVRAAASGSDICGMSCALGTRDGSAVRIPSTSFHICSSAAPRPMAQRAAHRSVYPRPISDASMPPRLWPKNPVMTGTREPQASNLEAITSDSLAYKSSAVVAEEYRARIVDKSTYSASTFCLKFLSVLKIEGPVCFLPSLVESQPSIDS